MVVLSLLSHLSCLAASIVSVLGLSQARLFSVGPGGWGEICSPGPARSVLGELSPGVSKSLAGTSVLIPTEKRNLWVLSRPPHPRINRK